MTRNRAKPLHDQIVEEDEVIGIISGTTGFGSTIFPLQPGLVSTFPWLSQVAALYQRYSFESLVLYYKPIVSGFATAGQTGKVILSTDYDSAAGDLTSYRNAETMDPHADGMPYEAIELILDPKRLSQGKLGKFVRRGPVPPNTDVKTYDSGNLYISTQGNATLDDIGELRVAYRVRLMNPRLPDTPTAMPANTSFSRFISSAPTPLINGVDTPILIDTVNANGLSIVQTSPTSVTLQQGIYRLTGGFELDTPAGSSQFQCSFNWGLGLAGSGSTGQIGSVFKRWFGVASRILVVPEAGLTLVCIVNASIVGGTAIVMLDITTI
jgi:hypothetical protein